MPIEPTDVRLVGSRITLVGRDDTRCTKVLELDVDTLELVEPLRSLEPVIGYVTIGADGTILAFGAETQQQRPGVIAVSRPHTNASYRVFSDGRVLAYADMCDGRAAVWSLDAVPRAGIGIAELLPAADGLLVVCLEGDLFRLAPSGEVTEIGSLEPLGEAAFWGGGSFTVLGSPTPLELIAIRGRKACRVDLATGRADILVSPARERMLHSAVLRPDGRVLLVGGFDGPLKRGVEPELYEINLRETADDDEGTNGPNSLGVGSKIRVLSGVFSSLSGEIEAVDADRATVRLNVFGKPTTTTVSLNDLEEVDSC